MLMSSRDVKSKYCKFIYTRIQCLMVSISWKTNNDKDDDDN